MSKIQPSAQDDHFWLLPIVLVRDTSIKKFVKDDHLSYTAPIWVDSDQHFTQDKRVIFARLCFATLDICFGHVGKFLYRNILKKITCIIWPHL